MLVLPVVDKTAVQLEDRMVVVSLPFPFLLGLPAMGYMPATAVVLQPNPSLWLRGLKGSTQFFFETGSQVALVCFKTVT